MKNKPLPDAPATETASSEDALRFVQGLQEEYIRRGHPGNVQAFAEEYLDRFSRSDLRSIGRRILMDIMKRPQVVTDAGREPEAPGGAAPALARRVREKLEAEFDAQFAEWVRVLSEVRVEVLATITDETRRRELLDAFAD